MTAFLWNGPNPDIFWPGTLNWNEPRNWNRQDPLNPPSGGLRFPTNGDDAAFEFAPPGTVTGSIAFQNLNAGVPSGGSGFEVKLSGVNCIDGYIGPSVGTEIDIVDGRGQLTAFMQGGSVGSSGLIQGCILTVKNAPPLDTGLGGNIFQNFDDVVFKLINPGGFVEIFGNVTGFSPLQVGLRTSAFSNGRNAELDVWGGGSFTGGVTSEFYYGLVDDLPSLNLKSNAAAGAAGQPIKLRGGKVTFAANGGYTTAWAGHPLVLDVGGYIGPGPTAGQYGVPLAAYLPDIRFTNVRNSGATWHLNCFAAVEQLCGTGNLTNGFVGRNDQISVKPTGALVALKRGQHFHGTLSFDGTGGKFIFPNPALPYMP
jgi:hypothetical protein